MPDNGYSAMSNIFIEMLSCIPPHTPIHLGEGYTVGAMIEEIRLGTETGQQYMSDMLRISRDVLGMRARKP